MDMGLKDKAIIVTGASRGIGRAIAHALVREGAHVSICARGGERLEQTRAELAAINPNATIHASPCDVSDVDALKAYFDEAHAALGSLHVLVNNPSGFGEDDDEEGWQKSLDVDLMALVRASWLAVPFIERAGGGNLIHISSISGMAASPESPPYGAVKAAVIHYTTSQAKELAARNIRVNCIAPGSIYFEGGVWDEVRQTDRALFDSVVDEIPFGRMGKPEEIADLAVFLASGGAGWITGQTIACDGGQLL